MNFRNRSILFLKALVKKTINVPGYTRRDGSYVPPHQKTVQIDPDHGPKFHEHMLPEGTKNAKTYNPKYQKIAEMHAAGDVAGLAALEHGVNTYNVKGKKLTEAAIAHLTSEGHGPLVPEGGLPEKKPKAEVPEIDWEKYKHQIEGKNAKSHNKKVEQIKALHAAGDIAGLEALTFGVNTYNKQAAKLRDVAVAHLKEYGGNAAPAAEEKPEAAPAPETPAEPEKAPEPTPAPKAGHFGEQNEGKEFIDGHGMLFKFEGGKWQWRTPGGLEWEEVTSQGSLVNLDSGKNWLGEELHPHAPKADAPPPAPAPEAAAPPAAEAPPATNFGEKNEGKVFKGGSHTFKFENGKWFCQTGGKGSWGEVKQSQWLEALDQGQSYDAYKGSKPLREHVEAEPEHKPHTQHELKVPTGALAQAPIGAKGGSSKYVKYGIAALKSGDLAKLQNLKATFDENVESFKKFGQAGKMFPSYQKVQGFLDAAVKEVAAKAPAAAEKHFGEQNEGKVFAATSNEKINFKFEGGKWHSKYGEAGEWGTVKVPHTAASLNEGKFYGEKLVPVEEPAAAEPEAPKEGSADVPQSTAEFKLKYHLPADGALMGAAKAAMGAAEVGNHMAFKHQLSVFKQSAMYEDVPDDELAAMMSDLNAFAQKHSAADSEGPKEGDTKQGAEGQLVFKNGRWHKVGEPEKADAPKAADLAGALDAVQLPEGLTSSAEQVLNKLKANVLEQGPDAFKQVKKQVTKQKYYANKKMHLTFKGMGTWGGHQKATGWVDVDDSGRITGSSANGKMVVSMWNYIEALKAAHVTHHGGKLPKKKKAPAAKVVSVSQVPITPPVVTKDASGVSITAMDGWEKTGPQKGSNEGGSYKDKAGQEWYVKFPKSADHAKNELLAAKLYEALGIAVPKLKLIKQGDRIGIASKIVDGVSKVGPGIKDAEGALDGFAVDAWLANHDSVGTGYDNLLRTADGKAIRIDVGGSLLYRAQGEPKGGFGNTVDEIKGMRDPSKNSYAHAVFGGIEHDDLVLSVAKVVKVPDDFIRKAVMKYGPGSEADKQALADKLIARRNDLAKQFPEAMTAKPKPVFKPENITEPPNFANWKGPGVGLSSKPHINEANDAAVQAAYTAAIKGDLETIKNATVATVDYETGKPVAEVPLKESKSQHVAAYWNDLVTEVDMQLNPPEIAFVGSLSADGSLEEIADAFGPVPSGAAVKAIPANQKAGEYIVLGSAGGIDDDEIPKEDNSVVSSTAWKTAASAAYSAAPHSAKQTFSHYMGSSGAKALNTALRNGNLGTTTGGKSVKQHVEDFKHLLVDIPQGATFVRNMGMSGYGQTPSPTAIKALQQFLMSAEPGTIVQEPGFSSTSWAPHGGILSNNDIQWQFTAGPGVKMFPGWLGANSGEGEGLLPPNQRYLIVGAEKSGKTVKVKAILLPTLD